MKRPAAAENQVAKIARKEDSRFLKSCLNAFSELDIATVAMQTLVATLDTALVTRKDQRHDFEKQVVAAADNLIQEVESKLRLEISDVKSEIAQSQDDLAKIEHNVQNLDAKCQLTAKITSEKKRSLADVAREYKGAKLQVRAALDNKKTHEGEIEAAAIQVEVIKKMQEELIEPLAAGIEDREKLQSDVLKLSKALKSFDLDQSILVALPKTFGKHPQERGPFDNTVVSQVVDDVRGLARDFEATLKSAEEKKSKLSKIIDSTEVAFSKATEKQIAAADIYEKAHEEELQAISEKQAEIEKVRQTNVALAKLGKKELARECRLQDFIEGAFAAFAKFRDRESEPAEIDASSDKVENATMFEECQDMDADES